MGKAANLAVIGSIADTSLGFRNRILNGGMVIDQRNAGASVSTPPNYVLDRWKVRYSSNGGSAGTCTVQRSTVAPSNFTNSQLLTVGTARTVVSGDRFGIEQPIEGFNIADFGWGTAAAQSVTVSFWVRSSVTGNFGLCLSNFSRGISALYTINAANTWEQKTVTFVGDTSGTWDTTNGTGTLVVFDLGMGSDVRLSPGAWSAGTYLGATGGTNLVSTSGATFYITGVQLEAGSVASPFERRDYGRELMMCQRYYEKSYDVGTAPGAATAAGSHVHSGSTDASSHLYTPVRYKVQKRAAATVAFWDNAGVANQWAYGRSGASGSVGMSANGNGEYGFNAVDTSGLGATWVATLLYGQWTANAEL